jgi:flagellar biogenesis protein FliO
MEYIEATMPSRRPTSMKKALFFMVVSLAVLLVYLGIPLFILMHSFVRTLPAVAGGSLLVVGAALAWTVRILRATSPALNETRRLERIERRDLMSIRVSEVRSRVATDYPA